MPFGQREQAALPGDMAWDPGWELTQTSNMPRPTPPASRRAGRQQQGQQPTKATRPASNTDPWMADGAMKPSDRVRKAGRPGPGNGRA